MHSFANQVLDFHDDSAKMLFREIAPNAPGRIKTASVITHEEASKMPDESFALSLFIKESSTKFRKFPICDEASTWLSAQYFEKTAHKLPEDVRKVAAAHLKLATALFNIEQGPVLKSIETGKCDNTFFQVDGHFKTASEKPVTEKIEGKQVYALGENYAMPTQEYVKKAAAYFVDYSKGFSSALDRHTYATNVLGRAEELKVELDKTASDLLERYAGSATYGDTLNTQLNMRKDLVQHRQDMAEILEKVASKRASATPEQFSKLLYKFDKEAGLDKYYDKYLSDAFRATFENRWAEKEPEDNLFGQEKTACTLSSKQLNTALDKHYEKIASYFGSTLASNLKKHPAAIFDSLPLDAREVISKISKGEL